MKIKRIEPIAISLPLTKPIKMAGVELRAADNVLVRLETDRGIVGWGEAASAPSMTGETVESMMAAIRYLVPYLEGFPLDDIAGAAAKMDRALYGNQAAKSAVEIALHDALGKAREKPVFELLGGKQRERVPMLRMIAAKRSHSRYCRSAAMQSRRLRCIQDQGGNRQAAPRRGAYPSSL